MSTLSDFGPQCFIRRRSNTLAGADYVAVIVARTAAIAPTDKVLRIEVRNEELPLALRQSLSELQEVPERTGHI